MRSTGLVLCRVCNILFRYGIGPQRISRNLFDFIDLIQRYNFTPTCPITASVLNRFPTLFLKMQEKGAHIAAHGYRHIDYTKVGMDKFKLHMEYVQHIFQKNGIRFSGYRFPFLKWDEEKIDFLENDGFLWESSKAVSWNSLNSEAFQNKRWLSYKKILNTYQAWDADDYIQLPTSRGHLIEIPVAVPDDDILIERLGLRDSQVIGAVWTRMINRVRERGKLLVLNVHPERYRIYKTALEIYCYTQIKYMNNLITKIFVRVLLPS